MRTNIEIDDALMAAALKATGAKTKREAVEIALRQLVQHTRQKNILDYFGKIPWEGDLDEMRLDKLR
jgi:Arc/MetJ family transcription regulator